MNLHQYSQALTIAETALRMFREIGDILNEMHALNVLAIIKNRLGRVEAAEAGYLEALRIAESISNDVGIRWVISNLSNAYNKDLGEYSKILTIIEDQEGKRASEWK